MRSVLSMGMGMSPAAAFLIAGLFAAATASAEITSGPQVGDAVGAFTVTKVAGNADDGFPVGRSGCYRCKTGSKPVVMVFARTGNESLAKLLKKIDEEVEEHQDEKLMSFVNMLGTDLESIKSRPRNSWRRTASSRLPLLCPKTPRMGRPTSRSLLMPM